MKNYFACLLLCGLLCLGISTQAQPLPALNDAQLQAIGQKIYHNETGSKAEHLIAWNDGEAFASLGIGHFIWFPIGLTSPFTETFPDLLRYMQAKGVKIPDWLVAQEDCPWQSKQAFQSAQHSQQMHELNALLLGTFELQVGFIYERMQKALPLMLKQLDNDQARSKVRHQFYRLATTELGMYALIDYVNFKGEGVAETEKYQGQGWGLLQVLAGMPVVSPNINQAFSHSCQQVLTQRVKNSPQADIEQKWLAGWVKRCQTYTQ